MANVFPSTPFGQKASTNQPYTAPVGDAKDRIPEIHDAAAELQSCIERLHSRIAALEDRLSSVLMPIPQNDLSAVRREMMSPVGIAILSRATEVDQAINRIDRLLDALAV
jgi:hypothetical protein